MNNLQILITVLVLGISVALTRFIPFFVFKNTKKLPKWVDDLGKMLPAAMMGLLVIYCLKDYSFAEIGQILPAAIAVAAIVVLHLWKRNTILSIAAGTAVYMVLIRLL